LIGSLVLGLALGMMLDLSDILFKGKKIIYKDISERPKLD